jgi:hypothetical protein
LRRTAQLRRGLVGRCGCAVVRISCSPPPPRTHTHTHTQAQQPPLPCRDISIHFPGCTPRYAGSGGRQSTSVFLWIEIPICADGWMAPMARHDGRALVNAVAQDGVSLRHQEVSGQQNVQHGIQHCRRGRRRAVLAVVDVGGAAQACRGSAARSSHTPRGRVKTGRAVQNLHTGRKISARGAGTIARPWHTRTFGTPCAEVKNQTEKV